VTREGVGPTIVPSIASFLRSLADGTFTLLFPSNCRVCSEPLTAASRLPVCQECRDSIQPIEGNLCSVCGERNRTFFGRDDGAEPVPCGLCRRAAPAYSRAVAFGPFEDALREVIHLLKYDRVLPAAGFLGGKLSVAMTQLAVPEEGWLVAPVPLHAAKLHQRGFNQAELVARAALKRLPDAVGFELSTSCLARQRETVPQAGLTRHQRRENIRGAFMVRRPEIVRGREILLVDDVFTTGTTISECARVLRRAGAAGVCAVTVARVLKADRIMVNPAEVLQAA